ncbi:hypothetical protein SK128_026218 [Halocaridina rubra]|uniref:Zinc finger protein 106 n=1 Tax=Halocaridina rubra TaxID=373956 RepID=A0AAN8XAN1_HALRR
MRHSRWDLKEEQQDGPKEQPRRWNNGSSQMEWSIRNDAEAHPRMASPPRHRPGPLATPPRHRGTPSPLDYRSESRRRYDNQNDNVSQEASGGPPHSSQQSSMGPPSTHYAGSWPLLAAPNIYADSGQSHHPIAQYPARLWGQNHPAYYPGDAGQYIFDLKWWAQQKQSMDAYLDGHCWRNDKNTHQNAQYPQWSFGTRVMKNYPKRQSSSRSGSRSHPQDGGFSGQRNEPPYDPVDPRRRHSSLSQRGHKHRDGMLEDHEHMDPQRRLSLLGEHSLRRNGAEVRDFRKFHPGHHQPLRETWGNNDSVLERIRVGRGGKKNKQRQQNRFEFNLPHTFKAVGNDFSKLSKSASSGHGKMVKQGDNGAVPVVVQSRLGVTGKTKSRIKGKSLKGDESTTYAEAAKKKALAAAANKLKRTFLAAKKKKGGSDASAVDEEDEDDDEEEEEDASEMTEENNAQDLSMPRRHPSCLEFDIDIRFSAKEWASVGRGQGGACSVLGRPQSPSSLLSKKPGSGNGKDCLQLKDSRYSYHGDGDDQEDSGTYSDSDIGKAGHHFAPILTSQSVSRRRHLSESSGVMDLRKNPTNASIIARPAAGRVRSCSLSVVEGASSSRIGQEYTGDNRTCVRLHFMPKLKRMMLKQLLTMDKKSLQELVDDPRSRKAQFMMTHLMSEHRAALSQRLNQQRFKTPGTLPEEELQLLNSLDSSQLNSFPSDVVQQVREILAMEERGEGGSWEEVSLSVNDLLNADSDPDLDCQIISPPPRDPTSTITIHDSEDSEMEEALHNNEREQEDDEEDDEDDDHVEDEEEGGRVAEACRKAGVPSEAENARCKREPPSPLVKVSEMLPPVAVEVPLCVMDPIAPGPSNSRDIADQVAEKISLMSPTAPNVSAQCPSVQELPVPGPSSILLSPAGVKVKEERPSPVSECGLCMHNPRTPHTSECLYQYGVAPPSPVPLMPGPPRPLGTSPPQRPVPRLPTQAQQSSTVSISSSLYQRSIKQEKLEDPYLKFEHVKRPSSEERPKNPAPPDAAREELLPLPLPPPAQALHPQPHPRPLIFSPDEDFPGPPRPPPPPPPQFSPRIKLERHTPVQFMCCCMRNECERNSTHSAEMRPLSRRSLTTPQPNERRPTPHLYKMEPPSPCASRARTPHQSVPSIFPPPASPRCINSLPLAGTRVTVGVQTEKDRHIAVPVLTYDLSSSNNYSSKKQYVPNLTLARSVTPNVITKMDQSTTTDDLGSNNEQQLRGKIRPKSWHRNGRPKNCLSQLSSISSAINEFEFSHNINVALQQMMILSEQENEFVRHIESLDQDMHELLREKRRITEELGRIQNLRIGKLQQLTKQCNGNNGTGNSKLSVVDHSRPRSSNSEVRTPRLYNHDSSSDCGDGMDIGESSTGGNMETIASKDNTCVQSTTDNASVVSSSQEKGLRVRSFSFSHTSSNDSSYESQSVRRQRCTSTCHSPGRNVRSKEVGQEMQQGLYINSERFFQESPSNSHKVDAFASESETDNDVKAEESVASRNSEAVPVFNENVLQVANWNRNNSFSSSAEGDVESEVPAEQDEDRDVKPTRLRIRMSSENEAVVDSSDQRDGTTNYEDNQNDLKDLESVKQIADCLQLPKELVKEDFPCKPSTSKENIKTEENVQRINSEVKPKIESHLQNYPTSSHICSGIGERDYISKDKHNEAVGGSVKEEMLRSSRNTCTSASPSSSPDSQKCRNSSGEHCYSLRSRGPPSETIECASLNSDFANDAPENSTHQMPLLKKAEKLGEEEHADDEREIDEEDDNDDVSKDVEGMDVADDKKRKRKRKTKKHKVNKKRKKKKPESSGSKSPLLTTNRRLSSSPTSSSSHILSNISDVELQNSNASGLKDVSSGSSCDAEMETPRNELAFVNPPPHGCAVLDIKVIGDFVLTASSDGTARCYDLLSGRVMATYVDHTDVVTCVGVIGKPSFLPDGPDFTVVTGSADKTIRVFTGRTGEVKQHRLVGEGVRCIDIAWNQLFIGTEGGCGARWNLKDKKVSEMVQYCGKAVTSLRAMTEGGRRVLLVSAKTTPLMIRDAMSGLFLRTLEHIQLTVYATVSYGGLLYSGGSNKTIVYYDFTSGNSRGHISCEADVSCLAIFADHLIATCYDGLIRIFSLEVSII